MPTASVNGAALYYEELGEGRVCLVMHGGLGFDHTYLRPDFDRLGSRFRVVYYDHRGNGRSGRPPVDTITIEQLADDAADLLTHVEADDAVVVGHSFGGFVAQELAIRHPERVAALVLLGTTPGQLGRSESPEEASGPPPPPGFAELVARPPRTDEELRSTMRQLVPYYFHDPPSDAANRLLEGILDAAAMNAGMRSLSGWSSVDRLPLITAPALLVVGEGDVFCSPSQSWRIARRLPQAEVVVLDRCGHMSWMEAPERFWAIVEEWLDGTRAASPSV